MELIETYHSTVPATGALATLMLVQLLIADLIGIRAKHIPGTPVEADHKQLLFRAGRAVANTNESIAIYILALLFAVFSGVSADWMSCLAWAFVGLRFGYALCYYLNLQILRSVVFALSLLPIAGLLGLGFLA